MANGIKIGNLDISAFKVGSDDCKVYLGDTLLYPQSTPPTPTFGGKWLATYTGGTTSSAECDSSSAITYGEIANSNLVSVEIGDCVTSIGVYAFTSCYSLTSCTIGNSVTSIGYRTFEYCTSLTSIAIPDSVTSIGDYTFDSCTSLTSIAIPDSVTSIGDSAFNMCTSLTSIAIPDSVTSIGGGVFYGCTSLTSVDIPDSVTSIGDAAFYECSGLTSITVNATEPPTIGSDVFYNTNNCPIYVPAASVDTYKSANNWSSLVSRIQPIPNS